MRFVVRRGRNSREPGDLLLVGDETERLLGALVPHGHDEDETRVHHRFGHAQEEPVDCDAGEVVARRGRDHEDAPNCRRQ